MIVLDLPPQIEIQVIQTAKQQNMSANDYLTSLAIKENKTQDNSLPTIAYDELYCLTGIRPLPSRPNAQIITNDYVNELRELYGI